MPKTADSMQDVNVDMLALQQQILSLIEALAKQKEESEKLQTELNALRSSISVAEVTMKDGTKRSISAISITSLTKSAMRSMLAQARSALSVLMMELEDSAKNMEIVVQKYKDLMEENEELKQELERLQGGHRLTTPNIKLEQLQSEMKETITKQEENKKEEREYGSTRQSRKYEADEDMDDLQDELKTCKAENERMLTLITRLTAEGKSRESVKEEALLLLNQLLAEILRYQGIRDSFHKLQTSTENVMKEATQAAVSDDRLKRMGEVHLLENQYKAHKLEIENLWRLIASLKSDIEKLRTLLPDNISEVSVTICEQDNVSEEMKNVCTQLIAAKEENKRLLDILDNLRQGIETLQCKLTEISNENENLTMQRQSSDNEELKGQADDLSSRLTKFVKDYPKQMPDTDSIRELTKEIRCLREKLVVIIATCNIESIKEENLRLENLLKVRETEVTKIRELLSANGIQVLERMEVPIDVIKEPKKTDDDTYEDASTKELLSHLAAENELLKKHLQRRTMYTAEIIIQLEEENELLKKQLSSETQIIEDGRKETILPTSKPTVEIKAPQQRTIETKGITDATQQCRRTYFAGKVTEKALRKEIDSLHKQLHDANGNVRRLETTLHELRKAKSSLKVTAPPKGRCGKSVKEGNETLMTSIPIVVQQSRAKSIAETENEKIMRNRIESLKRQLSDANRIVRSLQEATTTVESENERNLHNIIEGLQSQLSDANNKAISFERTLDELRNEYQLSQAAGITEVAQQPPGSSPGETDNERSLRNQVESLQKQLSHANSRVISLERTRDELRDEYISVDVPGVTEVPRCSLGAPVAESENKRLLRQQTESLQKQLTDAKGTVTLATITAQTEKERMQQNQIEILQKQLTDANNVVRDLETTLDELRDQYESVQISDITAVARQSHDTSAVESENERMLRNKIESLEKQLSNAKSTLTPETITVKTEKEKMLQNQFETLQNQLNELVQELKDRMKKLTDENNVLKSRQIKDEVTQETVPQDSGVSAPSAIDPEIAKVMKQLKTDNESLRNQLEEDRKGMHKTSDVGTEYKKIINELKTQNLELKKNIEEIRLKQSIKSLEDPGTKKIINQMTQENELLKKQVQDLKMAQARPSSAGSSRDPAFEQLMKDNEALRDRLENARKNIPVTSGPQEAIESRWRFK